MSTVEVSVLELVSSKYEEEIIKSDGKELVSKLKFAIDNGEPFPQSFIINMIDNNLKV